MKKSAYQNSGVDIELGNQAVASIKNVVAATHSNNVLKGIGLFSGFYELDLNKYNNPVIVSSIDGVGTKVKIAEMLQVYDTIGRDLVNHCINDIAVCGAEPIFFVDYIAADKLDVTAITQIVRGMALACKEANCALIGGETAEMPGVYRPNCFDLAGAITGLVEKDKIIDGQKISAGNVLIGIPSNGLHTNGYSLVRKIFFDKKNFSLDDYIPELQSGLCEELLRPHKSYLNLIRSVIKSGLVLGISHITGGGIVGNTIRLLSDNLNVKINWSAWQWPFIFEMLMKTGNIDADEMRKVFNLGMGLVLVVPQIAADGIMNQCKANGEKPVVIGEIINK